MNTLIKRSNSSATDLGKGWLLSLLILMVSFASYSNDASFDEAQFAKSVRLNVDITSEKAVIKQMLKAEVELLSLYPFAQELALPYIDIEDAVIVKDTQPITRTTRIIDGQKWYSQKSSLYLFPMLAKQYVLPSFSINTKIKFSNGGEYTGKVSSKSDKFIVNAVVDGAENKDSLVVGEKAMLNLTSDREITTPMKVGEAVVITYTLNVANSHTMMLPDIKLENINGVEIYRKPAEKENIFSPLSKKNRAVLKQSYTLIFQEDGHFMIPELTLKWWDSVNGKLHNLSVASQKISVGNSGLFSLFNRPDVIDTSIINWMKTKWLYLVLLISLSVLLYWLDKRYRYLEIAYLTLINRVAIHNEKEKYITLIKDQQYSQAVQIIYHKMDALSPESREFNHYFDKEAEKIWQSLLKLAYDKNLQANVSTADLASLYERISLKKGKSQQTKQTQWNLNPTDPK